MNKQDDKNLTWRDLANVAWNMKGQVRNWQGLKETRKLYTVGGDW